MHMIRNPAHPITFAIRITNSGGKTPMNFWPHVAGQQGTPVFGAENEVEDNEAQGLWHGDGAGFQPS
jgi:hypothetical protein